MKYEVTYEIDAGPETPLGELSKEHLEAMVAYPPSEFLVFTGMREVVEDGARKA